MDYSKIIKNYREKHIITQQELADMLGVSFSSVNRWENKHFEPTIKVKRKIVDLINKDKSSEVGE